MTPAARIETAATLLDAIFAGDAAEKVLTGWARRSRYAGSKDRAAVRDLVFAALRCRRSFGWLGGGTDGRAMMLGRLRAEGIDPATLFTGARHALAPLTADECAEPAPLSDAPAPVRLDVPDWVYAALVESLGAATGGVLAALRDRAPVFLRANRKRIDCEMLVRALESDGFDAAPHHLAATAIVVQGDARGLVRHAAFERGDFEFQDAASQAVVEHISHLVPGASVLDYCAGGGGKALALAGFDPSRLVAHDRHASRMRDLAPRADRAGVSIETTSAAEGLFDIVVCDVPCSGSGAWRRQPDAKWRLDKAGLDALRKTQGRIIDSALRHVLPGGHLAYMTCSLLACENEEQIAAAEARHASLQQVSSRRLTPLDGGDGFFVSLLQHRGDASLTSG